MLKAKREKRNKLLIILLLVLLLCGCKKANKIKKEYESLNKKDEYRVVDLSYDNPFVYIDAEELDKKLENKESFLLMYGSSKDNYSRSVISFVSDVALYNGIKEVYYIDRDSDVPLLIGYIKGMLSGMTNCISGYQTSPKAQLTEEMIKDSKDKITNVIKPVSDEINSCDDHGGGC